MPLQQTLAHIKPDSPRAETWKKVFGDTSIPLKSPMPQPARGPDGEVALFYLLDIDKIRKDDPAALDRLVAYVSEKFGITPESVWEDLADGFAPILSDDVSVSADARLFL